MHATSALRTRTAIRPPRFPHWLPLTVGTVGALLAAIGIPRTAAAQPERTVVLVRHAEKASLPEGDPALSDEGRVRAEALTAVLSDAQLGVIIVSPFRRTRETAAPAQRVFGVPQVEVPIGQDRAAHVRAVADAVRAQPPDRAILVVGHSNTIPAIVAALGGPRLPDLCDSQYAVLFVLALPRTGPARLVTASYGAPDPPDPDCRARP